MALSPIAIQAGLVMPGASAYALGAANLSPVITLPYEYRASHHWIFGTDYSDYTDLIAGEQLQPKPHVAITGGGSGYEATGALVFSGGGASEQATGIWFAPAGAITGCYITSPGKGYTSAPTVVAATSTGSGATFNSAFIGSNTLDINSVTTPATAYSGLITPITDAADQTLCAVLKVNKDGAGSNLSTIFGTTFQGTTNLGGTAAGAGIFQQGNGAGLSPYSTRLQPGAVSSTAAPAGASDGDYVFLALSMAAAGTWLTYWGGPSTTVYTASQVRTMLATPPKIALGQSYYGTDGYAQEFAEFFYIPSAMTEGELDSIYAASKARMAARPSPVVVY